MIRTSLFASALALMTSPVLAQSQDLLSGMLGQVETNAKAGAFDAAVESQAPAASVVTDHLSQDQKAQLFDYGVENSGTIGQLGGVGGGTGATALGAGAAMLGGGAVTGAAPQPTVTEQVLGTLTQPAYTQPAAGDVYGNALPAAPQAGAIVQPSYGSAYDAGAVTDVYGSVIQPQAAPAPSSYATAPVSDPYGTILQPAPQTGISYESVTTVPDSGYGTGTVYGQPAVTDAYGSSLQVQSSAAYQAPQPAAYGTAAQLEVPAPSYNPPSTVAAQPQSGLSYDPASGQVGIGADAIQTIGSMISN